MNKCLRLYWFLLAVLCGSVGKVAAQTITTGTLSASSLCAGGTISVPFTTSGTFATGNQFKVQLAAASGSFSDVGSGTVSPLTATIPDNANGTGFRIRVVSTNPAVNGTVSATTLTITTAPAPPGTSNVTYCQGVTPTPLTATASSGATLRWWGTSASGGSSSTTAPTPSVASAGSTTYYVSQTLNGCESDRAAITVTVTTVPAAPTTGAAPTYCQGAPASPLTATASGGATLRWYGTNQTGGTASGTAPTPSTDAPGTTTYYVSQAIGTCEGPRTGITVTVNSKPAPPTVTTPVSACQGGSIGALSATAGAGNTLNWYGTNASGGTASATAPTPSAASAGTTNYYVSQKGANGCESDRSVIVVNVRATPTAPSTVPANYCQNAPASALTATVSSGGTLNWYGTNQTGGTASAAAPTPPTSTTGTTTYYVSQTVEGCESARASLVVTVRAIPAAPTTTTPGAYCQDAPASALVATAGSGGSLNWYGTNQTGGTPSNSASVPSTETAGTTNYYVSQTVNGCESPRTAIAVTVTPKPALPTVTASFTYCQGATASPLTAVVGSGGTANWYGTNATGGTANPAGPTPSTTTPGVFTYYVSQTLGGCESNRASITVTVYATPAAPGVAALSICQNLPGEPLQATPAGGGTLIWYGTSATGGTATETAPTPPTSATGTTTYYVSQRLNGCEGPRASLVVTVKPQPAVPTVGASLSYCEASSAVALNATASTGGVLKWYGTNATGGTASGTAPTPLTNTPGTFTYYVSQTLNGCESERAGLVVTIKPKPAVPGTQDVRYCQKETASALTATFETGATLKWYSSPTSITALSAAPTPNTQTPGETTFYVSQNGANGCESDRGPIKVRIFATPTSPTVPTLPDVCQNTAAPVTLQASGDNLKWYTAETGGTGTGAAPVQQTTAAGTFTYYVSQTVEQCESPRAAAKITVKPQPILPGVESPVVCQDAQEQTLVATGTALKWFDANGNAIGGAPKPSTNVEENRVYTYSVTQTVNGCESQKATVTYTVNVTPKPTVVTPVVYCQNAAAKPLEATGQNLNWIDPYGREFSAAPVPPTTNISTKPEGDSYFVTQQVGSCRSRRAEIKLIVNAPPTAKIEGAATVNLGKTVPVTITFTSVPPFSYTVSDGTTGKSETMQQEINLLPTKKTTIYTITNISNTCGTGTPVGTFTVNAVIPTVTTGALSVTTVCVGTSIQVPFTTAGQFTEGNTYNVEMALVSDTEFANKAEIKVNATQSPITAPIPTTLAQGLYQVRVTATNPQVPVPGSVSSTILNIRALPSVTLTGTKDIYDNESTPLSFAFTGDAPWTFEYSDNSKTTKVTTSTNPHLVTVTPIASTTYTASSVSNVCGVGTATGTATIRVLPVLGLEPDPLVTAVKVFPVPTENTLTIDIDLPLQKNPAQLQLTDQNGRVMKQVTTRQRQTNLDLKQQPSGFYFLQIQIGDRKTVRKILKR